MLRSYKITIYDFEQNIAFPNFNLFVPVYYYDVQ